MTRPTDPIIEKAKQQVVTWFTTDVMPCSEIGRDWFIISVVNNRGGFTTLIDYKFRTSTGKLISSKTIEGKAI